jgi:hypothetical protein
VCPPPQSVHGLTFFFEFWRVQKGTHRAPPHHVGTEHIGLCLPTLARCVHKSRRSHELYQPLSAKFHAVQCDQGRRYILRKQVIRVVAVCVRVQSF